MDAATLALLMYLDEGLVKNLSSLVLSGFINIRTTKLIQDRTLLGSAGVDERHHNYDEDRCGEDERDGFRSSNLTRYEHNESTVQNKGFLENREFVRREEEIQRIYTSFELHSQLMVGLNEANYIQTFEDVTINEGDVSPGDYVKIHGELTTESLNSYIDSLLTVFECMGCDNLDSLIKSNNKCCMNFNAMNKFLTHLDTILNKNSTQDLILNCGNTPIILNVNNNFFMNNNAYIYDRVECPCTVYGKVIKVAPTGSCVSLLRKTAQCSFYENVLNQFSPYWGELTNSGIIVPEMPRLKCEGVSLIVVHISICM